MSDMSSYQVLDNKPTQDIINYEIDEENQVIRAWIKKPSAHTKYLINQGRCRITINCRNFLGHSGAGYHYYSYWNHISHKSGLGRSSYRFHKNWSLCLFRDSLLDADAPIKVTNVNNIIIPYHFSMKWDSRYHYYGYSNVKGFASIATESYKYENPYKESFYFDIRLALCSDQSPQYLIDHNYCAYWTLRPYQTKTKITRIIFENID